MTYQWHPECLDGRCTTCSPPVEIYKSAMAKLLHLRKVEDLSEDAEERLMEILETQWHRMTQAQIDEIEAWFPEELQRHG